MHYAALTHPGKVRDINEDNFYADGSVFIVADGMGGHLAGEVASTMAIETFLAGFTSRLAEGDIPRIIERAVRDANTAIKQEASLSIEKEGMGTTFTVAVTQGSNLYLGHVGDSRAYMFLDGRMEQLTEDHSLVESLVRAGRITREQALHHPQRNIITRALGIDDEVLVDIFEAKMPGRGWLMLCTDGLNGMVEDERLSGILAAGGEPEEIAGRLVEAALERGGVDNITVVLADLATYDPEQDSPGAFMSPAEVKEAIPEEAGELVYAAERNWRPLAWFTLGVALLLIVTTLFLVPFFKNRSYFVGVDGNGTIALYQGFPWKPLGIDLKEPHEASEALAINLPEYKQERLLDPEIVSLEEAELEFRSLTGEALTHVRAPDLMGLDWKSAKTAAGLLGLRLESRDGVDPDPRSLVVAQSPSAGELLELDTVIYVELQAPAPSIGGGT